MIFGAKKVNNHPRWDSNPQSSAPETDALSIRPLGLSEQPGVWLPQTVWAPDPHRPECRAIRRKHAGIAQLGERQTEDLKVAGSIPAVGILFNFAKQNSSGRSTRESAVLLRDIMAPWPSG